MYQYRIASTVKSSLVSVKGKQLGNFHLFTPDTTKPHELVLETIVEGEGWEGALAKFRKDSFIALDALACASGAPITWFTSSYLIHRQDSSVFLLYVKTVTREARVPVSDQIIQDAQRLFDDLKEESDNRLANLRLAIATSSANLKLMLSLFAAENIAGDKEVASTCSCGGELNCPKGHSPTSKRTDKDQLVAIIGKQLHERYFKGRKDLGNRSIRTALAHGHEVNLEGDDLKGIDELLLRLVNYVRDGHGISSKLPKTSSFEDIGITFEPWEGDTSGTDIYSIVRARRQSRLDELGFDGASKPSNY